MARRITVEEIKKLIEAEMKDPERPEDIKVKQLPWWDGKGVLAKEVDWLKNVKLKEMFARRLKQ